MMQKRLGPGGAAGGLFSIGSSTAAGQIVALLSVPILARLYPPVEFGAYSSLLAVATIFAVIGPLRLDSGIQVATEGDAALMVFASVGTTLVAGLACAAVVVVAPPVTGMIVAPAMVGLLVLLVLSSGLYTALSSYVLRSRRYSEIAGRNLVRQLGTTGGQLGMAPFLSSATGLMLGTVLGQVLAVLVFTRHSRVLVRHAASVGWSWKRLGRYWRFPVLFAPSALLNAIGIQIPLLFISASFGASAAGNLSQALRIGGAPALVVGSAFSSVVIAEIALKVRAGEVEQRARFLRASKALFGIGALWFLAVAFVAPPVLPFVLGPGWGDAGGYAQAVAVSAAASLIVAPLSTVLVVYERAFATLLLDVLRIGLTVGAGFLGLSLNWGAVVTCGLIAMASAFVYILTWFVCLATVSRGGEVPLS